MGRTADAERASIFEVLAREHRTLLGLLDQVQAIGSDDPREIADLLAVFEEEFGVHAEAEDEVLYQHLERARELPGLEDALRKGREEHAVIAGLLDSLAGLEVGDPRWMAKVRVVADLLARHVEQEEDELFVLAGARLDADDVAELADEFEEVSGELSGEPASLLAYDARAELEVEEQEEEALEDEGPAYEAGEAVAGDEPPGDDPLDTEEVEYLEAEGVLSSRR